MGWLIAAVALLALYFLPISIRLSYSASGACASMGIGLIRIPIYPKTKNGNKKYYNRKNYCCKFFHNNISFPSSSLL